MGITDFFKKKPSKEEARQIFINNLLKKYFGASKQKLITDARELQEITKYNVSIDMMTSLLLRCLGFHELNGQWNQETLNTLRADSEGKLPDVELKWIFDYCDLHYIHKNPGKEYLLLMELGGRQIGMPAPHEIDPGRISPPPRVEIPEDDLYSILFETTFVYLENTVDGNFVVKNGEIMVDQNDQKSVILAMVYLWLRRVCMEKRNFFISLMKKSTQKELRSYKYMTDYLKCHFNYSSEKYKAQAEIRMIYTRGKAIVLFIDKMEPYIKHIALTFSNPQNVPLYSRTRRFEDADMLSFETIAYMIGEDYINGFISGKDPEPPELPF